MLLFAALSGGWRKGSGASGRWRPVPVLSCAVLVASYKVLFLPASRLRAWRSGRSPPSVASLCGPGSGISCSASGPARWLCATVIAIVGCALLIGSGASLLAEPLGVLLCVFAGGGLVAFTTIAKGMLNERPHSAVMGVTLALGAVLLSPALLFSDASWVPSPAGLAVALELGLGATALAYVLFAGGLARVSVSTAATLSLAEPLTAGLLGVLVLGERLSSVASVGIALLVLGLLLASVGRD